MKGLTEEGTAGFVGPPDAEAKIRSMVADFYGRVRTDDLLGPIFEERLSGRWEAHVQRMCDFWSTVLHATGRFRGNPIEVHARIPGLAPVHFDRWIDLFEETANDILPPREAADVVTRSRRMRAVLERHLPTPYGDPS